MLRICFLPTLAFFVAVFSGQAVHAGLAHPASWRKTSADGNYVLVMVSPLPVAEDAGHQAFDGDEIRAIRARYSQSGLYRNDLSNSPLWTVPYYTNDYDPHIGADGKHLVFASTNWRQSHGTIAIFYENGNELADYELHELIPFPMTRARCGFYSPECSACIFDPQAMTLTVRTDQRDEFVFDAVTGKIIRQWTPWPIYIITASSLAILILMALLGWIFVRARQRREFAI